MAIVPRSHDLGIGNRQTIHDQVRDQRADELAVVMHRKTMLLIDLVPALPQFDYRRSFVYFLV